MRKLQHFRKFKENLPPILNSSYKDKSYKMTHAIYDMDQLNNVQYTHYKPEKLHEKYAFYAMKTFRAFFDFFTNYGENKMDEKKWLFRFVFLETIAGVPGMVAAMTLHLKALRNFQPDQGYIHTLLQEAENERMHLFTFLYFKQPGRIFRYSVITTQALFWLFYYVHYALSPKTAHKFVSYLEEEAVRTYTQAIKEIDQGKLPKFKELQLSQEMKDYWKLNDQSTFRDLLLCIRADEAIHREVNRDMSILAQKNFKDKNIYEQI